MQCVGCDTYLFVLFVSLFRNCHYGANHKSELCQKKFEEKMYMLNIYLEIAETHIKQGELNKQIARHAIVMSYLLKRGRFFISGFIGFHPVLFGAPRGDIWGYEIHLVSFCDI